ncbi:MAG: hypothetical protein KGO02_05000 [Alphaproteobacteria bacterium]|nr:hypothetical protein [Alphaproteobacteria bacterium]
MKATAYIRVKRRGWKLDIRHLALLVLLTFSFQAYIAQTHIDGWLLRAGDGLSHALSNSATTPSQSRAPLHRGHVNCPFCQAVLHAGAFVGPAPLVWLAPALAIKVITISLQVQQAHRDFAHIWQSRAPPPR